MAYVPNPTDATQPLDSVAAGTAAAEFRTLKAYIAGLAGLPASASSILQGGFRNRIINGCFRFDQNREGATTYNSGGTVVQGPDMFSANDAGGAGRIGLQKEADPDYPGEFNLLITVPTADAAIAAADNYTVYTAIEGNNIVDFEIGVATAKTGTLSFEIKSSKTGTMGVYFTNSAGNRFYVATFNIDVANTVERKTITVAMDQAGTWLKDTGTGLFIAFVLAAGTNHQVAAGAWGAAGFTTNAQTNFMDNVANTIRIKRVQFEQASAATPFERRSFGTEAFLVQRYAEKSYGFGVALGTAIGAGAIWTERPIVNWQFATEKRIVANTITYYNPTTGAAGSWRDASAGVDRVTTTNAISSRSVSPTIAGFVGGNTTLGHWYSNARLA